MADHVLCDACKAFLRGSLEQDENMKGHFLSRWVSYFTHHPDAESLKDALALPCAICIRLWNKIGGRLGPVKCHVDTLPREKAPSSGVRSWRAHFEVSDKSRDISHTSTIVMEELGASGPCGKPMNGNSGESNVLEFFATQYDDCRRTHFKCQRASNIDFLPRRVIDVGNLDHSQVSLCAREDVQEIGPYFTLSHCWGQSQPLTLTKDTAAELLQGVPVTSFPKTFRDAIFSTRQLGIRYLWIDSLCIFQDNLDDWHVESAQMGDYYGRAAACIAATAGTGCHDGLFNDRQPHGLEPIKVEATWPQNLVSLGYPPTGTYWCSFQWVDADDAVRDAPLNRRAWVAQERFLSPKILHFARDILFWECLEMFGNEANPTGLPNTSDSIIPYESEHRFKLAIRGAHGSISSVQSAGELTREMDLREFYRLWSNFLQKYSRLDMTKQDDCLVALSGIAQYAGKAVNDRLLAGLWENNLLEDLCWQANVPTGPTLPSRSFRPTRWRAPTWSWASSGLPVSSSLLARGREHRREIHMVSDVTCHINSKVSGQLESASLKFYCRLIPITICMHNRVFDSMLAFDTKLDGFEDEEQSIKIEVDDPFTGIPDASSRGAHLLILRNVTDCNGQSCMQGLVVARRSSQAASFERIGMVEHRAYPNLQRGKAEELYNELLRRHGETEILGIELF